MMALEESFVAPAPPREVIRRLAEIERIAPLVPGASLEGRNEDGSYAGVMLVRFGPKKLRFRGSVHVDFDLDALCGTLKGSGVAAMNAARISVATTFRVSPVPDDPLQSQVSVSSRAELAGALANLGEAAAMKLARALMEEFEANLAAHLQDPDSAPPAGQDALSGSRIVRTILGRKKAE